jgi:hypothetical protein
VEFDKKGFCEIDDYTMKAQHYTIVFHTLFLNIIVMASFTKQKHPTRAKEWINDWSADIFNKLIEHWDYILCLVIEYFYINFSGTTLIVSPLTAQMHIMCIAIAIGSYLFVWVGRIYVKDHHIQGK